jgi:hypothetical protein
MQVQNHAIDRQCGAQAHHHLAENAMRAMLNTRVGSFAEDFLLHLAAKLAKWNDSTRR